MTVHSVSKEQFSLGWNNHTIQSSLQMSETKIKGVFFFQNGNEIKCINAKQEFAGQNLWKSEDLFSLHFLYQGYTRPFGLKGIRLKCGTFSRKIYHFNILMTS